MTPILAEINRTASVAVTGVLALAIVFTALAVLAEPALKRQALINQERNVTWQK